MTGQPTTPRPFLDLILEHCGNPPLPDGYDTWGWKITRPDLRTYDGFRWPWPGGTVTDASATPNGDPCPSAETGGFCLALSWLGARSGGHGGTTALLIAYRAADALGWSDQQGKIRVRSALVADVIDVHRLIKQRAPGADLTGAYLRGAYLRGADLTDAHLRGADLRGADLTDAHLTGADLRGADLRGANLRIADLRGAYLRGADLRGADLTGAYLRGADLTDADLTGADLTDADLTGANLRGANLTDANLTDAKK